MGHRPRAPPGADTPETADSALEPAQLDRTDATDWIARMTPRYELNADRVNQTAQLPERYLWPLPDHPTLHPICYDAQPELAFVGFMLGPAGDVYHWGSDRFWLQTEIETLSIDSRELRVIARPGSFLEPRSAGESDVAAALALLRAVPRRGGR